MFKTIGDLPPALALDAAIGVKPGDLDAETGIGQIREQVEKIGACAVVFRERAVTCDYKQACGTTGHDVRWITNFPQLSMVECGTRRNRDR